jgi:hypothetical protein
MVICCNLVHVVVVHLGLLHLRERVDDRRLEIHTV